MKIDKAAPNDEKISDCSDWPDSKMQEFEGLLRCPICKDFYSTPLTILCDHSFCTLCLRQSMADQQSSLKECPVCRKTFEIIGARNNRLLESIIASFISVRSNLLEATLKMGGESRVETSPERAEQKIGRKRLKRSSRDESDEDFVPEISPMIRKSSRGIICPCCSKLVKCTAQEFDIFHLENCLKRKNPISLKSKFDFTIDAPRHDRKPLAKLWYNGTKDKKLREELAKYGLSTSGDSSTLEKRHRQFVIFWNAACDGNSDISDAQIRRQLEEWEKNQLLSSSSAKKKVPFDADYHAKKYAKEFQGLVEKVKQNRPVRNTKEIKSTSDENINDEFAFSDFEFTFDE